MLGSWRRRSIVGSYKECDVIPIHTHGEIVSLLHSTGGDDGHGWDREGLEGGAIITVLRNCPRQRPEAVNLH